MKHETIQIQAIPATKPKTQTATTDTKPTKGNKQENKFPHENPKMQPLQPEENDIPSPPSIKPTPSEVHACQFSSWYSTFRNMQLTSKHRKNVTIESIIIRPLPSELIQYLLSDGVRLPDCASKVSSCMNDANGDDAWDSNEDDSDNEEQNFSFPLLTQEIQAAIDTLGGEGNKGCMPKLNWSSPKDATWINCGSLKCTKAGDVYLLLKSSDYVTFDLERAWQDVDSGEVQMNNDEVNSSVNTTVSETVDVTLDSARESYADDKQQYELVLRKWCNLHPSMEFRCFVYDHELIAISQRHPSKYYSHLQQSSDEDNPLLAIIQKFFCRYVQKRFADGKLHRYVLDCYVDSQERTWIVDFNVWGSRTDGLLFDWEELSKMGDDARNIKINQTAVDVDSFELKPEFRVVTKDMKSMTYDPLSSYRGPTDVMDLLGQGNDNSDGFEGNQSFETFMKQCVRPSEL